MTATVKEPLGASTTNRKWYCDVNTGTTETPVWTGIFGIQEFKHSVEGTTQDDSDFDSEGWKSEVTTANGFKIEAKVKRAKQQGVTPAVYDVGQEVLREAGALTGDENVVEVRWYEMEPGGPRVEAYQGFVAVQFSEDGGAMDALSSASVTLIGRGKRNVIEHPDA
jgi:hypothetical protein